MNANIQNQYVQFFRDCKTLEEVETLEKKVFNSYPVIPEVLKIVISNEKVKRRTDEMINQQDAGKE